MARRRVKKSGKDSNGTITRLCNSGESWSPRSKADVINDIEGGTHSYYVDESGQETEVQVVKRDGVKHLQTTSDKTDKNNLGELPDC